MCGASMATTAGEVSVSKRMPITLSYSNAFDRSPNGAPKRAPAFRMSARRRSPRCRIPPPRAPRCGAPLREAASPGAIAGPGDAGPRRHASGNLGPIEGPAAATWSVHREAPPATAIPLSRRRPIRSLGDELFLFRHGAPFRASEQQAYSRPVFLANSGNLEGKRVEKIRPGVEDRWVFRSCFRAGAGIS